MVGGMKFSTADKFGSSTTQTVGRCPTTASNASEMHSGRSTLPGVTAILNAVLGVWLFTDAARAVRLPEQALVAEGNAHRR